jgi:hypothetical protein
VVDDTDSLKALVFLMMTWHIPDIGPTVMALWIDILRATVPSIVSVHFLVYKDGLLTWLSENCSH